MATSNTAIKITSLPNIGNNIAPSTIIPVVNMAGVPTTQKANLQITGNLILAGAGSANFVAAAVANLAYTVVNSNQSNITRVGTLNINTFKVSGGTNGQYIQTDGAGNLSWVTGGGSGNGVVGGSTGQIQFNNAGSFGGSPDLFWDQANTRLGVVNFAAESATIYGDVAAININASANIRPNAIYTDHYYYANGYVFGGGGGNGVPGGANTQVQFNNNGTFAGEGNFTYDSGNHILNVIRANVSYLTAYTSIIGGNSVTANFFIGSGANLTNIAGANVGGFVPNANIANTAFSVAVANVVGIGNIATVALNGNGSQFLRGNGTWGNATGGSANTGNVTFDNINIIGTGNLNLQPDPASAGAYLDVFLTSGPDVHLVASQNANLILGKDNQSNVMTSWNGNVYIQSWDLNTNAQGGVWTFGGDGTLTTPGVSGNITGANVIEANTISATYFSGNGAGLTNLPPPTTATRYIAAGPGGVIGISTSDNFVLVNRNGQSTINIVLPSNAIAGQQFTIKESSGFSADLTVSSDDTANVLVDGQATASISANTYNSVTVIMSTDGVGTGKGFWITSQYA